MIGIIGAMDIEVERLLGLLEAPVRREESGIAFVSGTLAGQEVVLARCGVGKVNAAVCAQTMILRYRPALVLNSGVAGSLTPELRVGDIAVGADVVQHDVDTTALGDAPGFVSTVCMTYFPCDEEASRAILSAADTLPHVRVRRVRIASGEQFVASSARKAEITRLFSAAACEMEAGAIAQTCFLNRVPCAVIRAISDGGDECAQMTYAEFLPVAAKNSADLLLAFLKDMNRR